MKICIICKNNPVLLNLKNHTYYVRCEDCDYNNRIQEDHWLIKEYDVDKNTDQIIGCTLNSLKKFWWKCTNGHSYNDSIRNKIKRNNIDSKKCYYCNTLGFLRKDLLNEWDYTKNDTNPSEVLIGSTIRAWWKCDKNHSWNTEIRCRAKNGTNCPYCFGNRNNFEKYFEFNHPELLNEWDYNKNEKLPSDFTKQSRSYIWWKCNNGHSYETTIDNKVRFGNCPYCVNQKVDITNCLATIRPDMLLMWDFEKNILNPYTEITPGSHKKAWWKCIKGHSWKTEISDINRGTRCPHCHYEPIGELKILIILSGLNISYERQKKFVDCKYKRPLPFDFYLPDYNVCIEYDGVQHFQPIKKFGGIKNFELTQIKDEIRNQYCKDQGIYLLRIKYTENVNDKFNDFINSLLIKC